MTVTVTESRGPEIREQNRRRVGMTEHTVQGDSTTPVASELAALQQLEISTHAIKRGAQHPRDQTLYAIDWTVKHDERHAYRWVIRWTYTRLLPWLGTNQAGPDEVGYINVTGTIRTEFVDAWRAKGTTTVPQYGVSPSRDDIGGQPIDGDGEPASIPVLMETVEITQVVQGSGLFYEVRSLSNTRNSRTFLGGPKGMILYGGAPFRRVGEDVWEFVHQFYFDEEFHLRQRAKRLEDGNIKRGSVTYANQPYDGVATDVYYVQPFEQLEDFEARLGIVV